MEAEILNAILDKSKIQADISILYAELILVHRDVDWPVINQAIQLRWSGKTALERVKTMAWKIVNTNLQKAASDKWQYRGKVAAA